MKTLAKLTVAAVAVSTLAACDPPRVYTDYANKVNAERQALGLKNHEWSPTEKRVMGPVVAVAAGTVAGSASGAPRVFKEGVTYVGF